MTASMRHKFFAISLFIGFLSPGFAQSNQKYYHTFSVAFDQLLSEVNPVDDRLKTIQPFEYVSTCLKSNEILVRIDAQYPKRREDIVTELREKLKLIAPEMTVSKVHYVSASNRNTFCK